MQADRTRWPGRKIPSPVPCNNMIRQCVQYVQLSLIHPLHQHSFTPQNKHRHVLLNHSEHYFPVSCWFFLLHFHSRLRADTKCHELPLPPGVEPGGLVRVADSLLACLEEWMGCLGLSLPHPALYVLHLVENPSSVHVGSVKWNASGKDVKVRVRFTSRGLQRVMEILGFFFCHEPTLGKAKH